MSLTYEQVSPGNIVSITMEKLHCTGIVVATDNIEGAWILTIQSEAGFLVSVDWTKNPHVSLIADHADDTHHLEPTG